MGPSALFGKKKKQKPQKQNTKCSFYGLLLKTHSRTSFPQSWLSPPEPSSKNFDGFALLLFLCLRAYDGQIFGKKSKPSSRGQL